MGISITEAESNNLISPKILSILPKTCTCGHKLEFTDSLRQLRCTNKNCPNTVLKRCNNFCAKFNIDIQTDELRKLVSKLKIVTPYQLLMLDSVYESNLIAESDIQNLESVIQNIKNIKEKEYFISEVVEMCGIEIISSVADKLFRGFNSMEEVLDEIDTGRVIFFNERLGIKSSDSTIISVEVYNRVLDIKEELIFAETQLKIKKHTNVLRIAFADNNTGRYVNKSELLADIENKYSVTLLHTNNINNSTDILIKNGSASSTKLRIARTINEKFIAESINSGKFSLDDVGKVEQGKLKPVGSVIYIDTLDHVLDRLDILLGAN